MDGDITGLDDEPLSFEKEAEQINAELDAAEGRLRVTVDTEAEHYVNLVSKISEVATLAQELVQGVERDLESRSEWEQKAADGISALGIGPNRPDAEYDTLTDAAFPLILEATVQLQARAQKELWPPNKPAKIRRSDLPGTEEYEGVEERRDRVESHFNHQLLREDVDGYDEDGMLIFYTAFRGTGFKYLYRDEDLDTVCSEFVPSRDLIVPYGAKSLRTVHRFTRDRHYDYRKVQQMLENGVLSKEFVDSLSDFGDATDSDTDKGEIERAEDEQQGVVGEDIAENLKSSATYHFYEIHTFVDWAEYGWSDPLVGKSSVPAPYVILVHKDTEQVGCVLRDWDPEDEGRARDVRYVKYGLVPNPFGYYDLGYFHLLGNLDSAATGILNSVVDGGIRASNQGGFMKSQTGQKGATLPMSPGVYQALDLPYDQRLDDAFYTPTYQQPSPSLINSLDRLDQKARGLGAATDAVQGTAGSSGPVGTILALIEQGLEVYSEIYRRIHRSKEQEFKIRARLNRRFIPEEGHTIEDGDEPLFVVTKDDYRLGGALVPVSDPQASSPQLRISKAEAVLQLSERAPGLYDQYEVHKRMLTAVQTEDIDSLLIDPDQAVSTDQVTENVLLGLGRPVKVEPWQDHASHIAVIDAFMASAEAAQLPEPQLIAIQAHRVEHVLWGYRNAIAANLEGQGFMLPEVYPNERRVEGIVPQLEDPEVENHLMQMAAQAAALHAEQNPAPPSEEEEENVEAREREELHQQSLAHKDQTHQQKIQHDQEEHELEMARKKDEERERAREIVQEELNR